MSRLNCLLAAAVVLTAATADAGVRFSLQSFNGSNPQSSFGIGDVRHYENDR